MDADAPSHIPFSAGAISASTIASHLVAALEQAQDAKRRGDLNGVASYTNQADELRDQLAITPAHNSSDRLAHIAEATNTAAELVAALVNEIVDKGLGRKARALMSLMERINSTENDEPPLGECLELECFSAVS